MLFNLLFIQNLPMLFANVVQPIVHATPICAVREFRSVYMFTHVHCSTCDPKTLSALFANVVQTYVHPKPTRAVRECCFDKVHRILSMLLAKVVVHTRAYPCCSRRLFYTYCSRMLFYTYCSRMLFYPYCSRMLFNLLFTQRLSVVFASVAQSICSSQNQSVRFASTLHLRSYLGTNNTTYYYYYYYYYYYCIIHRIPQERTRSRRRVGPEAQSFSQSVRQTDSRLELGRSGLSPVGCCWLKSWPNTHSLWRPATKASGNVNQGTPESAPREQPKASQGRDDRSFGRVFTGI
jgi:hypothetical protein